MYIYVLVYSILKYTIHVRIRRFGAKWAEWSCTPSRDLVASRLSKLLIQLHGNVQYLLQIRNRIPLSFLSILGLGRPSAGGPRMDRRALTSSGVVNISRLASRLRRSAWGGPDIPL